MTKRKTPELTQQHAINPSTNNKIEDGGENEVTEVVVASPARTSKRQQRQVVKYKDDSSDFEEEEKKKKAKKKPKKEPKARQQIVAFFNKTDGETDTPKPQGNLLHPLPTLLCSFVITLPRFPPLLINILLPHSYTLQPTSQPTIPT
jgi:hypothetical protein